MNDDNSLLKKDFWWQFFCIYHCYMLIIIAVIIVALILLQNSSNFICSSSNHIAEDFLLIYMLSSLSFATVSCWRPLPHLIPQFDWYFSLFCPRFDFGTFFFGCITYSWLVQKALYSQPTRSVRTKFWVFSCD